MSIIFKDIPKFLINLERRTDRLESAKKEFDYMGWSFERFDAVDTHSYEGCAYSHQKIANIIIERGYDLDIKNPTKQEEGKEYNSAELMEMLNASIEEAKLISSQKLALEFISINMIRFEDKEHKFH